MARDLQGLYVVVDERGEPVEAAGPAPFDGATAEEAEAEARATVDGWVASWRVVPLTSDLAQQLWVMADRLGL